MANIPFLNNAYFSAKVGIGTDSPDAKLDVEAGDIGGTSGDSATAAIFRAGRQNLYLQTQRTADGTDWNNTTFKLIAKIDSTSHQSINFVNDASYNEHIDIYTGNQVFNTRFNANGNVGIGTDSPDALLELSKSVNGAQGATLRLTNAIGGSGAGVAVEFVGPGTQPIHAKIITVDAGAYDSNLIFQTKATTTAGALSDRLTIDNVGAIQFNAYDSTNNTGTPTYLLGTDASGNIVKTNTVPGSAAGPYLPLAGGTMTGINGVLFPDNFKLNIGNSSDLKISHDGTDSFIEDSGTGSLYVTTNAFRLLNPAENEQIITAFENGAVNLFYDSSQKFETTSTGVSVTGDIQIDSALLSNQENTDIDTGAEVVAQVAIATYTAAFFDFVIKKTTNVRSGTVYACHDGTNVEFTETSTNDLGDTSDVTLSVDISGTNMRLLATVTSDDWSVKSLIRAI